MRGFFGFLRAIWPLLAGIFLLDAATYWLAASLGQHITGPPITMIAIITLSLNPIANPTFAFYDRSQSPILEHWTELAKGYADRLGINSPIVSALNGKHGDTTIGGYVKGPGIFITKKALDTLPANQIEFILCHELAHICRLSERRHQTSPVLSALQLIGYGVVMVLVFTTRVDLGWNRSWQFFVFLGAAFVALIVLSARSTGQLNNFDEELACDRLAVKLTGDIGAAVQALSNMNHLKSSTGTKMTGYPTLEQRVANLENCSKSRTLTADA